MTKQKRNTDFRPMSQRITEDMSLGELDAVVTDAVASAKAIEQKLRETEDKIRKAKKPSGFTLYLYGEYLQSWRLALQRADALIAAQKERCVPANRPIDQTCAEDDD
ncbi:MAG: hypothetical protein LUD72_07050 [Bacteroidales bacterium]|nr:hypothetical protein [Bacteroidales bacterium]